MNKHRSSSSGFILPALIVFSIVLMSMGLVVLQYVSSSTNSVQSSFYGNIAKEAANAGAMYAYSCIRNDTSNEARWSTPFITTTVPLTPDKDCNGTGTTAPSHVSRSDNGSWRSTYTIGTVTINPSGKSFASEGKVEFFYAGSSTPSKTFTATTNVNIPNDLSASTVLPPTGTTVTSISTGAYFTCAIANQQLYCWGQNNAGQLGLGVAPQKNVPTLIDTGALSGKRVDSVNAGAVSGCATAEGRAYCWGINTRGQLGNGTAPGFLADWDLFSIIAGTRHTPTKVTGPLASANVSKVALSWVEEANADRASNCAISNGSVYCWGSNYYAQLGQPRYDSTLNLLCATSGWVSATAFFVPTEYLCPKAQNTGMSFLDNHDEYTPTPMFGFSNRAQENKSLLYGKRVTDINHGLYGGCMIANGKVYCWGELLINARGDADPTGSLNQLSSALKEGPLTSLYATNIVTAQTTGCAIADGRGYCWGRLKGDGADSNNSTPKITNIPSSVVLNGGDAQSEHSGPICLTGAGNAYCWGLALPGSLSPQLVQDSAGSAITGVGTGAGQNLVDGLFSSMIGAPGTACYLANGSVYCMGNNTYGSIGNNTQGAYVSNFTKTHVIGTNPGEAAATEITSGGKHNCATINGLPYCWGDNINGQLGGGDQIDKYHPIAVRGLPDSKSTTEITAGTAHTCSITAGHAYCWGDNTSGQVGNGASNPQLTAFRVQGSGIENMAITDISAGKDHTCAVANSRAYCWGDNTHGQLGIGNADPSSTPIPVRANSGDQLFGKQVTEIAVGDRFTCAIADGQPYCWGERTSGKIGNGGSSSGNTLLPVAVSGMSGTSTDIQAGADFACAIEAGIPKCWGENGSYQLGLGNTNDQITPQIVTSMGGANPPNTTSLSLGMTHACAITNGYMYCWGDRTNGRVGDGTTTGSATTRTQIPENVGTGLIGGNNPYKVSAGGSGSCAIANGKIFCWGAGSDGQIGNDAVSDMSQPRQTASYTRDILVPAWSNTVFY